MDKRLLRKLVIPFLFLIYTFVLIGWQMYSDFSIPYENMESVSSGIRKAPDWEFYMISIGVIISSSWGIYLIIKFHSWSQEASKVSAEHAMRVRSSLWYVEDNVHKEERGTPFCVVRLQHKSFSNWKEVIPVRPGHPDIEMFRKLKRGDVVEFTALEKGMDCALEHELCGFLRIKSVS